MNDNNKDIETLLKKLPTIEDNEIKEIILKIIKERNYLIKSANIDPVSGLYNRRILEKIRKYEFVTMIDIDNFKTINDTFGHDVGDNVIRIISNILKNNSRSEDHVIRYGGDEFLIIFTGGSTKIVSARMEKIRNEVKEKINIPGLNITLSIGIAPYENNKNLNDTIKKADEMMYHSKKSGKDLVFLYDNNQKIKKKTSN